MTRPAQEELDRVRAYTLEWVNSIRVQQQAREALSDLKPGREADSYECAVARSLNGEFSTNTGVSGTETKVYVQVDPGRIGRLFRRKPRQKLVRTTLLHPGDVIRFIRYFDQGFYPDLSSV